MRGDMTKLSSSHYIGGGSVLVLGTAFGGDTRLGNGGFQDAVVFAGERLFHGVPSGVLSYGQR